MSNVLTPAEQSSKKLSMWQGAAGEMHEELLSWAPSFCPAHGDYAETQKCFSIKVSVFNVCRYHP